MKVQELLSSRDKWTQRAFARDKDNNPVEHNDNSAERFCLMGALRKCYDYDNDPEGYSSKYWDLVTVLGGSVVAFNDNHTHEEVMEVVRKADV